MEKSIVRIESVEIKNFKNVKHGTLQLKNNRKPFQASILGLYGQNGSGKTALIDALSLLKLALCGRPIPTAYADFINVEAEFATLTFNFKVVDLNDESEYSVFYEFSLRKEVDESEHNLEETEEAAEKYKAVLFDEVLSYSYRSNEKKLQMQPFTDTRTEDVFVPKTKYSLLIGDDKKTESNLLSAKNLTKASSRSFLFSREMINVFRKNCKEAYHLALIEHLVRFGHYEMFIINTANAGLITLNALPLAFRYDENGKSTYGNLMINLNGASSVPQEALDVVKKVIDNMNIVLSQIIPGLTIGIIDLGTELRENGKTVARIQLVSHKNAKDIPLRYESEGIKKIISILQLLIVVYNKPSIAVAIDEIDSGVFEYLLGEILHIISERGKGQLIFTSQNLRPLETIDKGFIAFTTTNPENRYIRLSNIKTNNNLRDFYYRDIVLGEQSEPVYEPTNNCEIALAFREAGELSGA